MKKLILFILFFKLSLTAFATHVIAGEITYTHISGNTYRIRVTTNSNTDPATTSADRCFMVVYFGDGDSATAPRINGASVVCAPAYDGEPIAQYLKKNVYEVDHTFSTDGAYTITVQDPNRIAAICNISNAVDSYFSISTTLEINQSLIPNNSPHFNSPLIYYAVVGTAFSQNLIAVDADGDSLAYQEFPCMGENEIPLTGYTIPAMFSIDSITGQINWNAPTMICNYNFAVNVKQFRNGVLIGSSIRDFQIRCTTDVTADVAVIENKNVVSLFPNPTSNKITIQNVGSSQESTFLLFDFMGRIVKRAELIESSADVDVYCLAKGLYHYQVITNNSSLVRGILVKQ